MTDIRRTDDPRTKSVVVKFTPAEYDALKQLALAQMRTPGATLRFLLVEALKWERDHA